MSCHRDKESGTEVGSDRMNIGPEQKKSLSEGKWVEMDTWEN